MLCCATHISYSTLLIFSFQKVFQDWETELKHLQRTGCSGSIFASPLWTQIPPTESPDFRCRCGLTVMQGKYQILGCGIKPFHTLHMAGALGGGQGGFIVLILWIRKLSLKERQ